MKLHAIAAALALTGAAQVHAQVTYTFQEGVAGYVGTQDTELRSNQTASPGNQTGLSFGNLPSLSVDGDDGSPGSRPNHGLLRFDNIFGSGPNQIKATDTITSATLRLEVFNPGSGMTGHNMLVSWSESSSWNSLVNGVNADGTDAQAASVFAVGANNTSENVANGPLSLNVLSSLLAWQSGSIANNGWALLPFTAGTNGIDIYTSEFATANLRPLLTVNVTPIPEPGQIALMLAGLGIVGAVARKTRRN
jgi:hypothetical protein